MSNSDDARCNLYHKNTSDPNYFHIANPYGGIPQNLVTNLIGLGILLLLFIILRKSAWKVINTLVPKTDLDRWTHIFFSFSNAIDHVNEKRRSRAEDDGGVIIDPTEAVFEGIQESKDTDEPDELLQREENVIDSSGDPARMTRPEVNTNGEPVSMISTRSYSMIGEGTFLEWLKSIFTMDDDEIEIDYGEDALQYLTFQRYIIGYLLFVMVLCLSVILPLNFTGSLQGSEQDFGHTTLANLSVDDDGDYLWVHISLSFFLFPVAILVMRRFSVNVKFVEVGLEMRKTLMIMKVPRVLCRELELKRHFAEAYPDVTVKNVTFAYDVKKLQAIYSELKDAKSALRYCNKHNALDKEEFFVYRANCSRLCCCFCCFCSPKLEATEFYQQLVDDLTKQFHEEKEKSLKQPIGIAFVTFATLNDAKEVFDSFQRSILQCGFEPPASSLSSILRPKNWDVAFAPTPDDIYWENLIPKKWLTLKYIAINVGLFFVAFFLTTPEYLVSQTDIVIQWFTNRANGTVVPDLIPAPIIDFLPTILLWSFTALLPLLVAYSDRWLGHYTRSEENHSIMKKTFWYLLFMVIFFPTFGFTTFQAAIEFFFKNNGTESYRWDCIFLPDSGAFFVNYVITAALVGTGLELIRFPEMFWYLIQVCWSRSKADTPAISRAIRYEFRFGEQYARMMLLFCMTMMFSVSCPLITPFGCLYFITKHYVDRHNIFYVYKPSKINKKVHASAIGFVVLSTVLLQFFMTIFSVIRSGSFMGLRTKYAIGLFLISVNIFSAQLWTETCKKFSPIDYMECTLVREKDLNQPEYDYKPDILKDGLVPMNLNIPDETNIVTNADENYGTFQENIVQINENDD